MLLKEEGWQGHISFKKASFSKRHDADGFFMAIWFIDNTS